MHIIAKRTLKAFWEAHPDAEGPLSAWYAEAKHAAWKTPNDIKDRYASASIIPNNRVVFNVGGNKYRLICHVRYDLGILFVRFVGTHEEYDAVDAATV
jgi:mRNA interferase HigB